LNPLQPRFLDLAGDDPAPDVEPAVGDRVDGRDSLDEARQDRERGDCEGDEEPGRGLVGERDREPGDGGDHQALQVEADDRSPGGMP